MADEEHTIPPTGQAPPAAPLPPLPDHWVESRRDYHRLAYGVVAVARHRATGRIGLRATPGGFGTPPFGADEVVRVDGTDLVVRRGDAEVRTPITTLDAAAAAAGVPVTAELAEHDSPPLGEPDRPLRVDAAIGAALAAWFAFGTDALDALRSATTGAEDPTSEIQLWPGHFDAAVEIGDADRGRRATYGASPGDDAIADPYLYVGPWGAVDADEPYWNATSFTGAVMPYAALLAADDPRAAAVGFLLEGHRRLHRA